MIQLRHHSQVYAEADQSFLMHIGQVTRMPTTSSIYINLTTLRTYKVDDIMLSILTHQTLATPGVLGLSRL
jgi:hypothetical protein